MDVDLPEDTNARGSRTETGEELLSTDSESLFAHFSAEDLAVATRVLETINLHPDLKRHARTSPVFRRLVAAGHRAFMPTEDEKKSHSKKLRKAALATDHALLESAGIRKMRNVKMVGMAGGSVGIARPPRIGTSEDNAKFITEDEERVKAEIAAEAAKLLASGTAVVDATTTPIFTHVEAGQDPSDVLPPPKKLNFKRSCHICGSLFDELHSFYDQLCIPCATLNYAKRFSKADMTGRVCIVTGARVKFTRLDTQSHSSYFG
ncbi:hypothetical protein BC830DRAFT_199345 [Chytriomyces sp. MP71]|nr:hypothetical protein BC830DRAFT_199345 [Chytriomyces sp. MP71]